MTATVLIIDDDPDVLATLRTALLPGFTVIAAGSAREAIDRLAFSKPDCIITDIYMPRGDGFDLMKRLRITASTVPVIAISGDAEGLEIAAQLGAKATIAKPFRGRELVETVKRVIEHGNDSDGG